MATLDELKKSWVHGSPVTENVRPVDKPTLEKLFRSRTKKSMNRSMQYFWASFFLQLLVYALLCNVLIRYWSEPDKVMLCLAGLLLYLPFTVTLMKRFKRMAITKPAADDAASMLTYVQTQHDQLSAFYRFKKRYELFLIPISTAIGVVLTFQLYVPGGIMENVSGGVIVFILSLFSCMWAIRNENRKHFREPIHQLHELLLDFNDPAIV